MENAEKEARKNRQRQKRAMQKVLSSPSPTGDTKSSSSDKPKTTLFDDQDNQGLSVPTSRQYSTLRKKPRAKPPSQEVDSEPELSYWQYYCLVVARVAETLLVWSGDEETTERVLKEANEEKPKSE